MPLATASISRRGPYAMSPARNTSGAVVRNVAGSHTGKSALRHLNVVGGLQERQIGPLADGPNHSVSRERGQVGLVKLRRESSRVVEHPETSLKHDPSNPSLVVQQNLLGTQAVMTNDAFLIAFNNLEVVRRQFIETFQAAQMDAQYARFPQRGSRDIDTGLTNDSAGHVIGDVSAADHDNLACQIGRLSQGHIV